MQVLRVYEDMLLVAFVYACWLLLEMSLAGTCVPFHCFALLLLPRQHAVACSPVQDSLSSMKNGHS